MSVNAVTMFYGKLASDLMMRKAFAEATSACAIKFAAERGYMFTEYDLQVSGENAQGYAKRFADDVKQLLLHQQQIGVAAKAVGKATGQAAGQATSKVEEAPLEVIRRLVTNLTGSQVHARLGEVFGTHPGAKQKSG